MSISIDEITALSGTFVSSYTMLHLTTHAAAILGQEYTSNAYNIFRKYYQNPFIEVGLGCALITHFIGAGLKYRNKYKQYMLSRMNDSNTTDDKNSYNITKKDNTSSWSYIFHRLSGFVLGLFIPLHIFVERLLPIGVLGLNDANEMDGSFSYMLDEFHSDLFNQGFFTFFWFIGYYHTIYGINHSIKLLSNKYNWKYKFYVENNDSFWLYVGSFGLLIGMFVGLAYSGKLYSVNIDINQKALIEPLANVLHKVL